MATFIIDLADVTTINIFGEMPGGILQTAHPAFIRMRRVEMNPASCHLVYQNVPDTLVTSKVTQS